ncbi:hypothetical protein HII31_12477, partial [Pseudocercospora fuligena]
IIIVYLSIKKSYLRLISELILKYIDGSYPSRKRRKNLTFYRKISIFYITSSSYYKSTILRDILVFNP